MVPPDTPARAATACHGVASLAAAANIEVIPLKGAQEKVLVVPTSSPLTITCSPRFGLERSLEHVESAVRHGYTVVPHLAARMVESDEQLHSFVRRITDLGVDHLYVIGGDADEPLGRFADAGTVLQTLAKSDHRLRRIGVACYPEGHPKISGTDLLDALLRKQEYADYMVSQLCFDPVALVGWLEKARASGVRLPLRVGLAAPLKTTKLAELSLRIGVGQSLRYLTKQKGIIGNVVLGRTYAPEELLLDVVEAIGTRPLGVEGVHLFFQPVRCVCRVAARDRVSRFLSTARPSDDEDHTDAVPLADWCEAVMTAQIIDGRKIAETLKAEVAREVDAARTIGATIGLATIVVGDDYRSFAYVERLKRIAAELGIPSGHHALGRGAPQSEVLSLVGRLNHDESVSGILVLRPMPPQIDEAAVFRALDPIKDVEALHPGNAGLLALGVPRYIPSTAASVYHVLDSWLDESGEDRAAFYHHSQIVVVGRSNNVGKPAVSLAYAREASVTSVDQWASVGNRLGFHTRRADVLIVAAGVPGLIRAEHIRQGAVVLDVGINPVRDEITGEVKLVGDAVPAELAPRARAITPVPGGVGPVTDVWLMRNVVLAALNAPDAKGDQ